MPLICFCDKRFNNSSQVVIQQANDIIAEYQAKGLKLTLRQLYYQFVSRDLIANKQSEYKRLGGIINDARLAGLIDWDAIEDRGRNLKDLPTWSSPQDIVNACARSYRIDLWNTQPYRPEVWIEKEALVGVIQDICEEHRVDYFACKGYVSQSEMWEAGYNRLSQYLSNGQVPVILHFGDHDPSGLDMTRDIQERLTMFAEGGEVIVKRLALNMEQIERYNPPPNPAKTTDVRFFGYQQKFGDESWELDALDPEVLTGLIRDGIEDLLEPEAWDIRVEEEDNQKKLLVQISKNMKAIEQFLKDNQ